MSKNEPHEMTGIIDEPFDEIDELVKQRVITKEEAEELKKQGVISGGMIPKIDCCIDAISHGVKNVVIMDGRVPHSILMEILTNEGAGTMVKGNGND